MEVIKNQDYFGHKIELKFKKKSGQHNTVIGGCVSVGINLLMMGYVGFLVKKLIRF